MNKHKEAEIFSDGTSVRILSFDLKLPDGSVTELALNIQKIKEIVEIEEYPIQPLTENYYPLLGLVNLRGSSIPVLDLNHFFNGSLKDKNVGASGNRRLLICEFQKLLLGILVDRTHKIKQFDNSLVKKIPDALVGLNANIFNGMVEVEGKFIKLLDIEYILVKLNVDIAPEAKNSENYPLHGKKVLIVEDSRLFQKKILALFKAKGAETLVAEDGVEGLEMLNKEEFLPDLIFTDIEMPRLNGIGMVRKIKQDKRFKDIPVIFNTSISNQGLIDDINSEGLGAYIVKFDESEINRALKKQLF